MSAYEAYKARMQQQPQNPQQFMQQMMMQQQAMQSPVKTVASLALQMAEEDLYWDSDLLVGSGAKVLLGKYGPTTYMVYKGSSLIKGPAIETQFDPADTPGLDPEQAAELKDKALHAVMMVAMESVLMQPLAPPVELQAMPRSPMDPHTTWYQVRGNYVLGVRSLEARLQVIESSTGTGAEWGAPPVFGFGGFGFPGADHQMMPPMMAFGGGF